MARRKLIAIAAGAVATAALHAGSPAVAKPSDPPAEDPDLVLVPPDMVTACLSQPRSGGDIRIRDGRLFFPRNQRYAGIMALCVDAPAIARSNMRVAYTVMIGASPVGFYGDVTRCTAPSQEQWAACKGDRFLLVARALRTCSMDFKNSPQPPLPFGCAPDPDPAIPGNSTITYTIHHKKDDVQQPVARGIVRVIEVRHAQPGSP